MRPFERMLDALDDLSPRVEAVDVGVALVDIAGLEPMWGSERRIAARAVMLARAVAPLRIRCGIGDNRWLATLAARLARFERPEAPAALHVLDRGELPDLSLGLLPVDAATRQRFTLFGLTRMGQLAELPRSAVGAQFGVAGERLQALARGHDPRPIVPRRRPERVEAGETFEPALDGVGAVGPRPAPPGRRAVRPAPRAAPGSRPGGPDAAPRGRAGAPSGAALPAARARAGLDRAPPALAGRGCCTRSDAAFLADEDPGEPRVVAIGLVFDRLADPAARQLSAFEAQAGRWEELRWSLERIRHRFGAGRLWRAELVRPSAALAEHRFRLAEIDE